MLLFLLKQLTKEKTGKGEDEHSQAWSEYRKEGKMYEVQIVCWALIFPAPEWAVGMPPVGPPPGGGVEAPRA